MCLSVLFPSVALEGHCGRVGGKIKGEIAVLLTYSRRHYAEAWERIARIEVRDFRPDMGLARRVPPTPWLRRVIVTIMKSLG